MRFYFSKFTFMKPLWWPAVEDKDPLEAKQEGDGSPAGNLRQATLLTGQQGWRMLLLRSRGLLQLNRKLDSADRCRPGLGLDTGSRSRPDCRLDTGGPESAGATTGTRATG